MVVLPTFQPGWFFFTWSVEHMPKFTIIYIYIYTQNRQIHVSQTLVVHNVVCQQSEICILISPAQNQAGFLTSKPSCPVNVFLLGSFFIIRGVPDIPEMRHNLSSSIDTALIVQDKVWSFAMFFKGGTALPHNMYADFEGFCNSQDVIVLWLNIFLKNGTEFLRRFHPDFIAMRIEEVEDKCSHNMVLKAVARLPIMRTLYKLHGQTPGLK